MDCARVAMTAGSWDPQQAADWAGEKVAMSAVARVALKAEQMAGLWAVASADSKAACSDFG